MSGNKERSKIKVDICYRPLFYGTGEEPLTNGTNNKYEVGCISCLEIMLQKELINKEYYDKAITEISETRKLEWEQ